MSFLGSGKHVNSPDAMYNCFACMWLQCPEKSYQQCSSRNVTYAEWYCTDTARNIGIISRCDKVHYQHVINTVQCSSLFQLPELSYYLTLYELSGLRLKACPNWSNYRKQIDLKAKSTHFRIDRSCTFDFIDKCNTQVKHYT